MRLSDRHPAALAAYALAALLALFELAVLWQTLHPTAPDAYRAYYIDRTTTCLAQPVTGAYTLGTTLDFRADGDDTRELRPCGWDGPSGDGMSSIGTSSRLSFKIDEPQDLMLTLEIIATPMEGPPEQTVLISAGGASIGQTTVAPDETRTVVLPIPASAIGPNGYLDVLLDYPDAIQPGRVADTYWRSIKLISATLAPQT